jgi:hypothetical protein
MRRVAAGVGNLDALGVGNDGKTSIVNLLRAPG